MRRVPRWLTELSLVLAVAACGTGGGHPEATASHGGQTDRAGAGWAIHASAGWRIVQALPSEPGSGEPGGGYNEMLSVGAVGARDVWAVGDLCPRQCDASSPGVLVEHWAGARWRKIPLPPAPGRLSRRR